MAAVGLTDLKVVRTVVDAAADGTPSSAIFSFVLEGKDDDGGLHTFTVQGAGSTFPTTNAAWADWWTTHVLDVASALNYSISAGPTWDLYQEE